MRQQISSALKLYNKRIGASAQTLAHIDLLAEQSVVVMTGQQPGIFTGPLYTIYKALAACMLAKNLSDQWGTPVIPVFWVGSEDHDFAEINQLHLPTNGEPLALQLPYKPNGRVSVGTVPINSEALELLKELMANCPGGYQEDIHSILSAITTNASSIGHWFAAIMAWLFKDFGLVLVDALLPELRQLQRDFFRQVLDENKAISAAFFSGVQNLSPLGLSPQVELPPNRAHLFIYHGGQRIALYRDGSNFISGDGQYRWNKRELMELALDQPERFSPNVILKPVGVEILFPLLAYVAGPGEISYYGLTKHIYSYFGRKMPIIYPRPSITLVEPRAEKYLAKYHLSAEQFIKNPKASMDDYLTSTQKVDIANLFKGFQNELTQLHTELNNNLKVINSQMEHIGQENLRSILKKVKQLQSKAEQRHRKAHQTEIRQFNWLQHRLVPTGGQERVYNIVPFLSKYGPDLINGMGRLPLLTGVEQNLIYIL